MKEPIYRCFGKRLLDVLVAALACVLCLPLFVLVALCVRLLLGPGVFFCQRRPGLHGQPFTLLKFRTMTHALDARGNLLPDAQRLLLFGRFLRSTSLDELPGLINVLKGDMSLVGPRPLLMRYLGRYTLEQARRHLVRPGITGWAQVNGRNTLSWEQKFACDVWYVQRVSLGLDIKIIAMTVWKILIREGINEPGQATAAEFMGSSAAMPPPGFNPATTWVGPNGAKANAKSSEWRIRDEARRHSWRRWACP